MSHLKDKGNMSSYLLRVRARWDFLVVSVQARAIEAGFPWIEAPLVEEFRALLNKLDGLIETAWLPDISARIRRDLSFLAEVGRGFETYRLEGLHISHDFVAESLAELDRSRSLIDGLEQLMARSREFQTILDYPMK